MEFSEESVRAERALTAGIMLLVAAAAWLQWHSPAAARLRAGKPWTVWVAFDAPGQDSRLHLALLDPSRRTADLVYVPGKTETPDPEDDAAGAAKDRAEAAREELAPLLHIDEGEESTRFIYVPSAPSEEPDAALAAAQRIPDLVRRLALSPSGVRTDLGAFDRLVLALELARLGRDGLRPAWLPEDVNEKRAFLGRLGAGRPEPREGAITVEVLNASGARGIALNATKVLRLGGADVVSSGNAAEPRSGTVIYDRAGEIENALAVRRMLGCGSAKVVTQTSAKRLVEVTLLLADDCAPVR
jgi:hypothetical protein